MRVSVRTCAERGVVWETQLSTFPKTARAIALTPAGSSLNGRPSGSIRSV